MIDKSDCEPAVGERKDWIEFYCKHSNCGGTWVFIDEPTYPRVVCSCGITPTVIQDTDS